RAPAHSPFPYTRSSDLAPVGLLVANEFLAVRPVRVADGQSHRGIGIQHLLGGDDLDLARVSIEPELPRRLAYGLVIPLDQFEGPDRKSTRLNSSHVKIS